MQPAFDAIARQLVALKGLLQKGEEHCAARKIDPSVLLGSRLFPDMLPLVSQVRIACDHAKGAAHRLAGLEVPSVADDETTFAQLRDRIDRTLAMLRDMPARAYDGAEERVVTMRLRSGELTFKGADYLWNYALPNFFFHAATAYNILRHNGVELGKRDFLARE
jgi:hypothetical protein